MINTRQALRIGVMSIGVATLVMPSSTVQALHADSTQTREYLQEWKEAALNKAEQREQALREKADALQQDIQNKIQQTQSQARPTDQPQALENANENSAVVRQELKNVPSTAPAKPVKLTDARLKACQNREAAIQNIMSRLSEKSMHQLDVFTKIADRAMAYYESNSGSSAAYDDLVEAMRTHRVLAEDAVTATHDASYEFDCEGADPRNAAAQYSQHLNVQNTLLKQYKSAVKDLVVEIRTATAKEAA